MHGDLDKVYATLKRLEEEEKTKIDLLLCCGDFQVVFLFAGIGIGSAFSSLWSLNLMGTF